MGKSDKMISKIKKELGRNYLELARLKYFQNSSIYRLKIDVKQRDREANNK